MTRARAAVGVLIALVVAAAIATRSCGDVPAPDPVRDRTVTGTRTGTGTATGTAAERVAAPMETLRRRARAADVTTPVVTEAPRTGTAAPAAATTGVSISVVDESGALVDGAEVRLWPADAAAWLAPGADAIAPLFGRRPRTSGGAPVVLDGLPPEVDGLRLRAFGSADGFPPLAPVEFALVAGRVVEAQLVATPARSVSVTVTDAATDAPVPGARVASETERARRERVGAPLPEPAVTDANGRCVVEGLGGGEHEIAVNSTGYSPGEATWDGGDVTIRLLPCPGACTVHVTVRGPAGVPVPEAVVWLVGTDRRLATDGTGRATFAEVPPGFVMVSLAPGEWDRVAEAGRWGDVAAADIAHREVADGGTCDISLGVLPAGTAWITGRVLDERGAPVPAVRVDVYAIGAPDVEALTDAGGAVRLGPFAEGKYGVAVHLDGGATWFLGSLELADGEQASATWTLGARTVRGRVVRGDPPTGVGGVPVWIRGDDSLPHGVAVTGADGRFVLPGGRDGTYEVQADAESAGVLPSTITLGPDTPDLTLEMVPHGSVVARFAPEDRERLRGCVASAFRRGPGMHMGLLRPGTPPNDLGPVSLLPGTYDLHVTIEGTERTFPFEVESGRTTVVELRAR